MNRRQRGAQEKNVEASQNVHGAVATTLRQIHA
jgi:hypothetical protein